MPPAGHGSRVPVVAWACGKERRANPGLECTNSDVHTPSGMHGRHAHHTSALGSGLIKDRRIAASMRGGHIRHGTMATATFGRTRSDKGPCLVEAAPTNPSEPVDRACQHTIRSAAGRGVIVRLPTLVDRRGTEPDGSLPCTLYAPGHHILLPQTPRIFLRPFTPGSAPLSRRLSASLLDTYVPSFTHSRPPSRRREQTNDYHNMARLFSKKGGDEQGEKTAAPVQEVAAVEYSSEEGVVEQEHDDLHRGMRPRQLSACLCPGL